MKHTIQNVLLLLAIACMVSCYNDDKLWDAVNDQEERIAALETWQKQVNENISALQTLVNTNDYIKEVTPITLDGEVTGYTITFVHQEPITIYNGEKGKTGDTPQINLTKGEDGLWYWTLNGELMKDAEGNPVRANGPDGETGAPAPTPLLKTGAQLTQDAVTGTWTADAIYLSVDNGATWTKVSGDKGDKGDKGDTGATGPTGSTGSTGSQGLAGKDGDSFFKNVDIETDPNYVIFTLDNETQDEIKIPKATNIADNFDLPSIVNQTDGSILITYIGLRQNITMETVAPQGWSATVTVTKEPTDNNEGEGEITLTRSDETTPYGKLLVFLSDGKETTVMKSIDLTPATVWDGTYPTSADEAKKWMGAETSGVESTTATDHVFTITAARQLAALHYLMANDVKLQNAVSEQPDPFSSTEEMIMVQDNYGAATYNLTVDINLNNKAWTPIGYGYVSMNGSGSLKGTFNGQGHTVSGMNVSGALERAGLFSSVEGTVKFLNVKGNINTTSTTACGGITGQIWSGKVAFCSFQGSISATFATQYNNCYAGGIAGYVIGLSKTAGIISCYSVLTGISATNTGEESMAAKGGISGYLWNGAIKGCYWQEVSGLDNTNPYGDAYGDNTTENNAHFTNAAGANAAVGIMNSYDAGYEYHWQAGSSESEYPVLVKKQ